MNHWFVCAKTEIKKIKKKGLIVQANINIIMVSITMQFQMAVLLFHCNFSFYYRFCRNISVTMVTNMSPVKHGQAFNYRLLFPNFIFHWQKEIFLKARCNKRIFFKKENMTN